MLKKGGVQRPGLSAVLIFRVNFNPNRRLVKLMQVMLYSAARDNGTDLRIGTLYSSSPNCR